MKKYKVKPSEIQLHDGGFFDFNNMHPDDITINDIAHALSMLCRFNGHTNQFYSVAQHSVIVSNHVAPENALEGLMHDATEAYIGDMASPLKRLIPQFSEFEHNVWQHIAYKYDLPPELSRDVKDVDKAICLKEAMDLMGVGKDDWGWGIEPLDCPKIRPWSPALAKEMFLNRFHSLIHRRVA